MLPSHPRKKGIGATRLAGRNSSWRTRPVRVLRCSTGLIARTPSENGTNSVPQRFFLGSLADTRTSSRTLLHDYYCVRRSPGRFPRVLSTYAGVGMSLTKRKFRPDDSKKYTTAEYAIIIMLRLNYAVVYAVHSRFVHWCPPAFDDQRSAADCSSDNQDRLPAALHALQIGSLLPGRAMSTSLNCQIYQIVGYRMLLRTIALNK